MARPTKTSTAQNVTMATARPRRGTFHRCRPTTSGLSSRATKPDTAINRTTSRSRYRSLPAIKVTTTTATVTRIARSGMPCDSVDRHRRARRVCDGVLSGIDQAWQVHDGGGQTPGPSGSPAAGPARRRRWRLLQQLAGHDDALDLVGRRAPGTVTAGQGVPAPAMRPPWRAPGC